MKLKLFALKCIVCISLLMVSHFQINAQSVIKGKVLDEVGQPLMGATVIIKTTKESALTDADGEYTLKTKSTLPVGTPLGFSFIGYQNQRMVYKGKDEINVVLKDNTKELDNVVVTALGIKRSELGLGYATEKVDGSEITSAMSSNWSDALNGKVAGLSVISSGGPLGSTTIKLRGDVSLNAGDNGALIVVDGVPMAAEINNPGVAYGAGTSNDVSQDYGNGFSDINPDDIESVQILKGASATALYGTRAANGVVMVTTKSGKSPKKGIGVTFNSNTSISDVMRWPAYQYDFGQGLPSNVGQAGTDYAGKLYYSYGSGTDGNASTSGTSSAYGARFDSNQNYYQYDPATQTRASAPTPWVPYKNNRKGLFRTGFSTTNSIAISGNGTNGSARASVTHTKEDWILPNTGFNRLVV